MGRNKNLLPSDDLHLKVSDGLIEYLREVVATGLYGKTVQDAADRLISHGIDRLLDEGKIGPRRHFALQQSDDSDS